LDAVAQGWVSLYLFGGVESKFPEGQYSISRIGPTSNTVGIGKGVRDKSFSLFRFRLFHSWIGLFRQRPSPEMGDAAPNMTAETTDEKF
jgi:hypothetical protein